MSVPTTGSLISCDVFDTLLLRDGRSERSRHRAVALRAAERLLSAHGIDIEPDAIFTARVDAQEQAYRALDLLRPTGEVRFDDMMSALAARLGLHPALAEFLGEAEISVEREQLRANRTLLAWLAGEVANGRRVVAVSDTWHGAETIGRLLDGLAPGHPVSAIYTSADLDATKRTGALFPHVLRAEQVAPQDVTHVGDDANADRRQPEKLGIACRPLVRPLPVRLVRKVEAVRGRLREARHRPAPSNSPAFVRPVEQFGYDTLGPILAEFAARLWQFQRFLPDRDDATLLFCARGGLRLRLVYERFLARTGLDAPLPFDDLMVSRLVAARLLVDAPTDALLDELGREFEGRSMREVANALAQRSDLPLGPIWDETFRRGLFLRLAPHVEPLREAVAEQNALFRAHLDARTGGRRTIVLCDTGLYGSTLRLLRDALPERDWLSLQFARSNYKGYAAPHFDRTVGLCVERDVYVPWDTRSAALRFWHLIEAVLEPNLASVRTFSSAPDGSPRANLEIEGWQDMIAPAEPGLFSGALAYLDGLSPEALPRISADAQRAWRSLKGAVVWPGAADVEVLRLHDRSRDFGRRDEVAQFAGPRQGLVGRVRSSLWREGALVEAFPRVGRAALGPLELTYAARAVWRHVQARRASRRPHGPSRDAQFAGAPVQTLP